MDRRGSWSLDALVMLRPARAFRSLAEHGGECGWRTAVRRPLFLALVLGSLASLLATGGLGIRVVATSALAWSFVPSVEALALAALTWRRRKDLPVLIDRFFAGHAPWTLLLVAIAGVL